MIVVKHLLMAQLAAMICCCAVSTAVEPASSTSSNVQPLCGASCLYVALNALEFDVAGFEDLIKRLPEVGKAGHSLGELLKAAESYGAKTLAVETTLRNLERRKERFACIAHMNGNHFVLLSNIGPSHVTLIDPPHEKVIDRDVFSNAWKGTALLISADQLTAEDELNYFYPTRALLLTVVAGVCGVGIYAFRHQRAKR